MYTRTTYLKTNYILIKNFVTFINLFSEYSYLIYTFYNTGRLYVCLKHCIILIIFSSRTLIIFALNLQLV